MSEVTRKEPDWTRLLYERLCELEDRLSRVERLADETRGDMLDVRFMASGARSAALAVAEAIDPGMVQEPAGVYERVCNLVDAAAQQPAPTAEGAGVDLAASKAATTNADATAKAIGACQPWF